MKSVYVTLVLVGCSLLTCRYSLAVPACPVPATVRQPNGQEIQIYLRGDEFLHWNEDAAGYTILRDGGGWWVYANLDARDNLVPSRWMVGRDDPRRLGLPRRLLSASAKAQSRAARAALLGTADRGAAPRVAPTTGILKNLVILVDFPNMPGTHAPWEFWQLFNQPGYSTNAAFGSVRDYYSEVSYGQLLVDSTVTDWLRVPHTWQSYGGDDGSVHDTNFAALVQNALDILCTNQFDFSPFDVNGDGFLDCVTFVHAGWDQAFTGNNSSDIWSHEGSMNYFLPGGLRITNYMTVAEFSGSDHPTVSYDIARIGMICHEMGHMLGLPDLYDTGNDSEGAGMFCLMARGSWNGGDGREPAHLSAWCKKALGWVTPTVASASASYPVPRVEDNRYASVYQLQGRFAADEYFLIENRQGWGFDAGLPSSSLFEHGLLIWHVDESQPNNGDQTHYKVDLEEASGIQHLELNANSGDGADYYRAGNNTVFSSTSTPNSLSYSGTSLGFDIACISADGVLMSFYLIPAAVVVWGNNDNGQANVPLDLTNVAAIAGGGLHSLALKRDGRVVAWGYNYYGQTNVPSTLTNVAAIAAGGTHSLALKSDGRVVTWGNSGSGLGNVPSDLTNAVAIAGGGSHTLALRADGTMVAWGANTRGQATVPTGLTDVVAIAAGQQHSLALKADGTVVAWGDNSFGQATVPAGLTNVVAIAANSAHNLALKGDGTVVAWSLNPWGQLNPPAGLTNVAAIAAGGAHSVALQADGTVVAWGEYWGTNVPPCLGKAAAIGAGTEFSLALRSDGSPVVTVPPWGRTVGAGAAVSFQVKAVGDGPLTYRWKKGSVTLANGGNVSGATTATLTLTNVLKGDQGSYSVIVTNGSGATVTSSAALLTVIDPVITSQPASLTNIAGTTASFTVGAYGTQPLGYRWRKGGVTLADGGNVSGATNATLNLASVAQSDAASYDVVVTNTAGSVTSSPALLTVLDPPLITSQPVGGTTNAGSTALFSVAVTGTAPFSYQWRKDNVNLTNGVNHVSGATSAVITIADVSGANGGGYTVVITNLAGSVTSAPPATLTVIDPFIVTQPFGQTNPVGGMVGFTVVAGGTPPFGYQWRKDGASLTNGIGGVLGADSATLIITNAQWSSEGSYTVVITNTYGSITSAPAILKMVDPPMITTQPVSRTNSVGTTATFTVAATGTPPLYYAWLTNWTEIAGETNATLVFTNVQHSNAGLYRVRVWNEIGYLTSDPATLTVVDTPVITSQPTNQVANAGQTAVFTVGAAGTQPLSYQWRFNGTNLAGASLASCTITNAQLADAGFYSVVVTNCGGSVTSQLAQLVITATPVAQGDGTGLRGLYYDNSDFTSLKVSRVDTNVDLDWGTGSPGPALGTDQFSVRWLGQVQPRYSQTYTFYAATDDGVRLWVNGLLLIDHWNDQAMTEWSGTIPLTAGQKYDLRMDYYENSGLAAAQLQWSCASQLKEVIPQSQLYRPRPVLAPIADKAVLEGATLTFGVALTDWDQVAAVTPLEDFESFPDGSASDQVMFRRPQFSGSTSGFVDSSATNYDITTGSFPSGNASTRVLHAAWTFAAGTTNPWVRLTTFNAEFDPNPLILVTQSVWFDIYSDKALLVGMGVRETNSTGPIGGNGGTAGTIEFVGVTNKIGNSPKPVRLLSPDAWTTMKFNLPQEPLTPFTGNGVLESTTGEGVLEHLALVPAAELGAYDVYLDNFLVVQSNPLGYSLEPGAPPGAAVDPITGVFSWTPPPGHGAFTTNITVRVTDGGLPNLSDTTTFAVTVLAPPMLVVQPANRTNDYGTTAAFLVSATGTEPLSYQWRKDQVSLADATVATLTLTNIGRRDAGVYAVLVTNLYGSILSSNAALVVCVPQRLGTPCLLPDRTCVIFSGDADGGLLASNDLPHFEVYASTNLANWLLLTNCLDLTNGQLRLHDLSNSNLSQRFYQIIEH